MVDREVGQANDGNCFKMAGSVFGTPSLPERGEPDPSLGERGEPEEGELEQRGTKVPGRLYRLIGEVLSYTARVDAGETPLADDPDSTDTQQGEVRSRC